MISLRITMDLIVSLIDHSSGMFGILPSYDLRLGITRV